MQHVDLRAAKARQLNHLREAQAAQLLRQARQQQKNQRHSLRDYVADLLVNLAENLRESDDSVGRAVERGKAVSSG